ncbi:MAG: hypothetical protein ABW033_01825 [Acidimicrobiia bacterium]
MTDDRRDDELAARLDVEPLDDLTRRRLVSRAMAESATDGAAAAHGRDRAMLTRLVAAAAVLLVLAVGVVGLLTTTDGGNDTTVAGRKADQAARATPQAGSGSVADQGASAAAEVAPSADATTRGSTTPATSALGADLGDVGDLSTAAARRRLLDDIDAATLAAPVTADAATAFGFAPCPPLNVSSLIASGTATFDGRPATVVVNERADGSRRVRLLLRDPCEVRQLR